MSVSDGRAVTGCEDPARHRHEVRREQHGHVPVRDVRERLLHLGRVASA